MFGQAQEGRRKYCYYFIFILGISFTIFYLSLYGYQNLNIELSKRGKKLEKEKDFDFIEFEINLEGENFIPVLFMTFNFYDNLGKISYERVIITTGTKEDSKYFLKSSFFDEIFHFNLTKVSPTKMQYKLILIDLPKIFNFNQSKYSKYW